MRTIASDDSDDSGVAFENAYCFRETDKAILVRLEDGREPWIPKSCVHDDSEVFQQGDKGRLVVAPWFAEKMTLGE